MRPNGRFTFWSAWIVFSAAFLICRFSLFDPVFYNVDEAEYAVAAQALGHGLYPGVDLLGSTKPPGIVSLYYLIFALFGQSLLALQIVAFALWLLLLYLTLRLVREFFPDVPDWMSGLSFFMIANSFGLPRDLHALNTELPAMVLALSALFVAAKSKHARDFVLCGILVGVASIYRQSELLFALVVPFLPSANTRGARGTFFVSILLPWLAVFAVYAAHGGLAVALDSWFRYPFVYSGDVGIAGFFQAAYLNTSEFVLQAVVPVVLSLIGLFAALGARNKLAVTFLVVSAAAVATGARFFGHYYIQVMPALAILSAVGLRKLFLNNKTRLLARAAIVGGVVVAFLHFPFWRYWDTSAPPRGVSSASLAGSGLEIELADYAKQNSSPDQSIFVWGYCPQIYFFSNRLPAARDFLCHYVTGYSAGSTSPRENYSAVAEQMLVEDLTASKPKLIFDLTFLVDNPYSFADYPLTNYPALAQFVVANYKPAAQVGSIAIYSLNTDIH